MEDWSFLKLFKNDFAAAKRGDNYPIVTLPYHGFLQQSPTEVFSIKTSGTEDISFVGSITVELVDCSEAVVKDITTQFYYYEFTDTKGVGQIHFEFGNINEDFYTKGLYLRITDDTTGAKWYSYGLLVTNYQIHLSQTVLFYHKSQINNIAYDVNPLVQYVRIANFYKNDDVSEEKTGNYTEYGGGQVNFDTIITDLDEHLFSSLDIFTFKRIQRLFKHSFVYLNGRRVIKNLLEKETRLGDTNWFPAKLVVNPRDEYKDFEYQLYEGLILVSKSPAHLSVYNATTPITQIFGKFNKNITLGTGKIILYLDGSPISEFTGTDITIAGDTFTISPGALLDDLGVYNVTIDAGLFYNGADVYEGLTYGNWTFERKDGSYAAASYNNTQYLTV